MLRVRNRAAIELGSLGVCDAWDLVGELDAEGGGSLPVLFWMRMSAKRALSRVGLDGVDLLPLRGEGVCVPAARVVAAAVVDTEVEPVGTTLGSVGSTIRSGRGSSLASEIL